MIKKQKIRILTVIFAILIVLTLYSIVMIIALFANSDILQEKYNNMQLKGKSFEYLIEAVGRPNRIVLDGNQVIDSKGKVLQRDYYYSYIYHTEYSFANFIGYFPFGGTSIYVDKNGTVVGLDPYME